MVSYTSNEPNNKPNNKWSINILWIQYIFESLQGGDILQELFTQEKSIYIQISEMIETDILRGILLEEERVPSTNELAKLYAINPATAAKGVNILVDAGILYKKRGIGMFVSEGAKEMILTNRKNAFYDNFVKAIVDEAEKLGISKEELTKMILEEN